MKKIKLSRDVKRMTKDGNITLKRGSEYELIKRDRVGCLIKTECGLLVVDSDRDVESIESTGTDALNKLYRF